MQDGGEQSLSLPLSPSSVLGDVASAAATGLQVGSSGSSENRIFVVATLAAIVLAGSAFAYRARPHAAISSKNDLVTSSLKETQHDSTDSQPRVVPGGKGKLPEGSSLTPKETQDAKESKISRSKDRRRRGKDHLKEVLKNPKKLKSLTTSTPTSTPPLSARSTIATTSTAATTPNTANSSAHINSIGYNLHHEDETDDSVDPTPEFPSPFDEHTSSSNTSYSQGSISRSKGKQVLQQEIVQRREGAWHDTLPIPGSSDGMISATHTADTSEVSQIDTPHSAQTLPQLHVNESSHTHRRLSQSSNPSLRFGPDLEYHHHQIPNHTYAVSALSSAPSMSQKYASTTRPPSSSSASPSVTPTDKDDSAFGQTFAGTSPNGLLELDNLAAHTISQARARFLARDDTSALGLGLALHSPPTPPDFCSALSSTSSSTESTDLSASTMTTNTSVTSGAASTASACEDPDKALQPPANPEQSALSSNINHSSADSSSSSSSSKTKHAPKAQHLPSAAASASRAKQNAADPWEWDGVTDAVRKQDKAADSTRKERDVAPKDSPKKASRKAGATSFSAIVAVAASSSPAQGVSRELEIIEETPVSFPTLNPTPASSSRIKSSQEGSGPSAQQPSTPRRAPTPRRPQTPSYNSNNSSNCSTPPPPSSTSSASSHQALSAGNNAVPALSTQTQLASMRGALEASRLREEKNKAELERVTKEMERLQWENANCKRGEMELRKQMAYLMHQVHSYAAMFAAVSPQFNLHLQQQIQMRNQHAHNLSISSQSGASGSGSTHTSPDSSASTSTPDGAQPSSSSSPPPQAAQDSIHPQVSSESSPSTAVPAATPVATAGRSAASTSPQSVTPPVPHPLQLPVFHGMPMNGNGSLASPMSAGAVGLNPAQFFQYPSSQQLPGQHFTPHPMAHLQQHILPFQHVGSPVQPSPHLPPFFNNVSASNGRISVNASPSLPSFGDGTFGMHNFHPQVSTSSPMNGPSSSGSLSPEMNGSPNPISGKRQSRSRNQRLNGRAVWEDGDGWIGTSETGRPEDSEGRDQQDDAESEGGFNELLADAILKRPGSIQVRSPKKGKLGDDDRDAISESERMTEFAFPSLSDMGNVLYRSGTRNVTEEYPTPSPSTLSSPSADAALSSLSASPKKSNISVAGEFLDEESDPSGVTDATADSAVAHDSPDSDKTPRKEQTEAQTALPPAQESPAAESSTPEATLYKTDHRLSS